MSRRPFPQSSRRLAALLLPFLALALVGFSLPDALILHPPHGPMSSTGATRSTMPFHGRALEVWTARSRPHPPLGRKAEVYVLRFYGNADRADPNVGEEAAGWLAFPEKP